MHSTIPDLGAPMRAKRRLQAVAAVLTLCTAGCGGGARASAPQAASRADAAYGFSGGAPAVSEEREANAAPPPAAPGAAPMAPSPSATAGPPSASPSVPDVRSGALLIYTAELSMAVFQVDSSLAAVERIGREAGGYLAARQDRSVTIR